MLNMEIQNLQQNPPQYPQQEQPQTQSSQATTQSTPSSKRRLKRDSKKSKEPVSEKNPDVTGVSLRWQPIEETLLASCYVAVSEDPNVGNSQKGETFWYKVLREFNRQNYQKRNKDMLTSKWHTLSHNCQKFYAIFKRSIRFGESGENDLDVMKRARTTYRDENKETPFVQEDVWEILRSHGKWDAPSPVEPVDLTGGEQVPGVGHEELFGEDARPRPPGPGKARPAQKSKSKTTKSTGGSNSSNPFGDRGSYVNRISSKTGSRRVGVRGR
ncbi:hypothetical protein Tco_1058022 [Tanacetum coccineum]|uniref:No apical meristem-associated C-terminal domain-containing protein n=1 Tax=Tanacetum coccineum TaxID=301880 RepID=A0ABQ5H7R4_9ASTR